MASSKYFTLTVDGWARKIGEEHILNFQACTLGASIFLDMQPTGTHHQTAQFIADALYATVVKHKLQDKIVALVTDNAANMKTAWEIFEKQLGRKIITFGCLAHVMNLFLKVRHCSLKTNHLSVDECMAAGPFRAGNGQASCC
jgi:hypothetical protein